MKKYYSLLKNLGFLSVLKVVNLVLPLIVYPYLIRILGKDIYGTIIFIESIFSYFIIIISFGFNLSTTKLISIYRNENEKLNEIVSSTYIIKAFFLLLCSIVILCLIPFSSIIKDYLYLYFFSFYLCIYEFLFPLWFFQGIEKMKYITFFTIIGRVISFLLIFFLVKSSHDYLYVPLCYGVGGVITIILSINFLIKKYNISFYIPPYITIKRHFIDSLNYFASSISVQIFANTNRFVVGVLLGVNILAVYDIIEKIIRILSVPTQILRQTLLPYVSKTKDKIIVRKTTILMSIGSVLIIVFVYLFADRILNFFGGKEFINYSNHLSFYSIIILFYNLGAYYLVVTLNSFNYQKEFMKLMLQSVVVYLALLSIIILLNSTNLYSFICITILVEFFIVIKTFYLVNKYHLI